MPENHFYLHILSAKQKVFNNMWDLKEQKAINIVMCSDQSLKWSLPFMESMLCIYESQAKYHCDLNNSQNASADEHGRLRVHFLGSGLISSARIFYMWTENSTYKRSGPINISNKVHWSLLKAESCTLTWNSSSRIPSSLRHIGQWRTERDYQHPFPPTVSWQNYLEPTVFKSPLSSNQYLLRCLKKRWSTTMLQHTETLECFFT